MKPNSPRASQPAARARILLVDDHPLVRERLAEMINEEPDLTVCGEAEDRAQAMEIIEKTRPEVAVIDLTLKNSDGLELIKDIRARWPGLRMLVVSMHDESLYAERVIRAGALGYITKQEAARNILAAIRRVLGGNLYVKQGLTSQILQRLAAPNTKADSGPAGLLAPRELQVFELTGHGLDTREVAERLGLGVKTVETYRRRIREKLNLASSSQLLQAAIAWAHKP